MKRIISILLCLVILAGLLTGCSGNVTEKGTALSVDSMDKELLEAYELGLLPDSWLEDMGRKVTVAEFNAQLSNVIALYDKNLVAQWEKISAAALQCEEPCQRDDAILSIFETALLMNIDHEQGNEAYAGLEGKCTVEDWWEGATRDYNYFPDWGEEYNDTGYSVFDNAVWFVERHVSLDEHKYIFEPTPEYTLGLGKDVSRDAAARALLRYVKSSNAINCGARTYMDIAEIGSYDKSIITDELLNNPTQLPEVSQSELPDTWQGIGISARKSYVEKYSPYEEADVAFISETGFNFARLFFGFSTLRYPDYPEDGRQVNEAEFKALDQLLAWCIEYDVHLQIAMSFYLDEGGNPIEHMPINDAQWELVAAYWEVLTRRYAGIDSRYLTFDLSNEISLQPNDTDGLVYAEEKLGVMVERLRAIDPERVLIYSEASRPREGWTEKLASMGLAISCHPYFPEILSSTDFFYMDNNPYVEFNWPHPYLPIGNFMEGVPLYISGDISGATLSLHAYNSGPEPNIAVYADDELIGNIIMHGQQRDDGEYYYDETLYSINIPEGTENLRLQVERDNPRLDTIIIEKSGVRTVILPSDAMGWLISEDPLPLIVNGDGTYTNSENKICDEDFIYEMAVKPYRDIAEKYGVGFMIGEFGVFGTNVDWNIEPVAAYHETYLEMVEKYDLPWCSCELFNDFPKHLIIWENDYVEGDVSQWTGATVEDYTLTYLDGSTEQLKVCKELVDVFTKYTMD